MAFKRVSSGSSFEAAAAYCRAVVDDLYIHVSGTVGVDPKTRTIPEAASAQMANIFAIIEPVLAAEGASLADVVRSRLYLTDAVYLQDAAAVLREKFHDHPPTNTTLICGLPAPGAKIELEITARLPKKSV
jgi:enamine deaminase RidA (YjgF/YER057c/UK114 family)